MTVALPPDVERFVEHEVATGAYSSREELISKAEKKEEI